MNLSFHHYSFGWCGKVCYRRYCFRGVGLVWEWMADRPRMVSKNITPFLLHQTAWLGHAIAGTAYWELDLWGFEWAEGNWTDKRA